MQVRERVGGDLEALVALVQTVHHTDGYPVLLQDEPSDFIVTKNCYAAWVATRNGSICGHVSLHTVWSDAVAEMAGAYLGCDRSQLGAVSRLFVDPTMRSRGVGRALLDVAVGEALGRRLSPVLDVVTEYAPAIAMYESAGWVRVGVAPVEMPSGEPIDEYVYVFDPSGDTR